MRLSLVVAASENHAIGKNNQLLWHLPNDMRLFKALTNGMPVIMGRKTFDSLGKPLAGRVNIVMTSVQGWHIPDTIAAHSLTAALQLAAETGAKETFVIGGEAIYRQALPHAHRIYMTRVHALKQGDTFFPEIPATNWRLLFKQRNDADAKHLHPYSFEIWDSNDRFYKMTNTTIW